MTESRRVDGRRPWSPIVGYSRAIRRGPFVEVSGTSATRPDGTVVAPHDAYGQTVDALRTVLDALAELGASAEDVTRTRVYLTDIASWEAVGRAHGEVFKDILPACTFVEVSALMLPELVVEVEASAIVGVD